MEYVFFGEELLIPVRGGVFTDSQYYPNASGGRITFTGAGAGFGIITGHVVVDVALQYETGRFIESQDSYGASHFNELRTYFSTIYRF